VNTPHTFSTVLYAHPKFVSDMVDYIVADFAKGRTALDESIGAMIVCDSAPQARVVSEQLKRYAEYSHALVLHDVIRCFNLFAN